MRTCIVSVTGHDRKIHEGTYDAKSLFDAVRQFQGRTILSGGGRAIWSSL
jgi:hypothetical protein